MVISTAHASSNIVKEDDKISITETSSDVPVTSDVAPYPAWYSMLPMVLIFVVFYFLLIRPQEKRRKEREQLVSGVKKGEEVITSAGIFGKVSKINDVDNSVNLIISENTEIKILKSAIVDILSRKNGDTSSNQKIDSDKNHKKSKSKKSV
jgi:preprotein translocase subunit YajC